jgi:hypothetical protein
MDQTSTQYSQLAEFEQYAPAQALVDKLSDNGFDVKRVRIVGEGLRSIEQVTGRLTTARAALMGAASGAWFGLFIGLLLGLFTPGAVWFTLLLAGLLFGAGSGAIFGAISHWATRGQRDFSSVRAVEAEKYVVMVQAEHLAEAQQVAGR